MSKKKLKKDEIRVIRLGQPAIQEILFETLLAQAPDRLEVAADDGKLVYRISVNETCSEAMIYVCRSTRKHTPDFDAIDRYIAGNVDFTTESFYCATAESGEYYRTIRGRDMETGPEENPV